MNQGQELQEQIGLFRQLLQSINQLNEELNNLDDDLNNLFNDGIGEGNPQYDNMHDRYLHIERLHNGLVRIRDAMVNPQDGYDAGYRLRWFGGHDFNLILQPNVFGFAANIPGLM